MVGDTKGLPLPPGAVAEEGMNCGDPGDKVGDRGPFLGAGDLGVDAIMALSPPPALEAAAGGAVEEAAAAG